VAELSGASRPPPDARRPRTDAVMTRRLERAAGRNLRDYVMATRRLFPELQADFIEAAGGVAAFTGRGSPLTTVKGAGPHISPPELQQIESFFDDHEEPVVTLELAPWMDEETARLLDARGYQMLDQEDVVVATSLPRSTSLTASERFPADEWPGFLRISSELADESPINEIMVASAHLTDVKLFGLSIDGRWVACAQSVRYGDVVIFGNDATLPEARRRGAQTNLIEARLNALTAGTMGVAEVARGSGSERNYLRCGFKVAYTRTQYARRSG